MTATASRPNTRAAKAELLATTGASWIKCRLRTGGKAYGIESASRPGLFHLVNTAACTCEDFRRRSLPCFHILAVRLYVASVVDLGAERISRQTARAAERMEGAA